MLPKPTAKYVGYGPLMLARLHALGAAAFPTPTPARRG